MSQDLSILSSQLKDERSTNEDLVTHRDGLEMEVGRLQSQMVMLQNEKHFLNENLETSTNRLKEGQQKLTVTSRELAQLQSMPQKVDELQAQVKEYAEKLSDSEVQVIYHTFLFHAYSRIKLLHDRSRLSSFKVLRRKKRRIEALDVKEKIRI